MSEVAKPSMRRRALSVGLASDEQAIKAAQDLEGLQRGSHTVERLDPKAPIKALFPSPDNPRRSLANAGVTRELIEQLARKLDEDVNAWRERYVDFLRSLTEANRHEDEAVWSELFDLAESIRRPGGLVQPIIAQPTGEIIAGERRWTACMLAGITHERVIFRLVGEDEVHVFRIIENLQRSNLNLAETAQGLRRVVAKLTSRPLGPDNWDINLSVIQDILGCKKTVGAQYLALCRLPDGDPMLAQILSGGYTGLRAAYEAIGEYKRSVLEQQQALENASASSNSPMGGNMPAGSPPPPPTPPTQALKPVTPPAPRIKIPMPQAQSGARLLGALKTIESLPTGVVASIETALAGWGGAPDAVRKKILTSTLEAIVQALDATLDEGTA